MSILIFPSHACEDIIYIGLKQGVGWKRLSEFMISKHSALSRTYTLVSKRTNYEVKGKQRIEETMK